MHLQFVPAVVALLHQDGIVEVASRFAVDGDDRQAAKVATAGHFLEIEMSHAAGFFQNVFGKHARKLVLADHHLHVDAEVVGIAQDFYHAAEGRLGWRGPACDLDIDNQVFQIVP